MSALAQWENRTTRRDDFKKDGAGPTAREIRSGAAEVRENWSHGERRFRAHIAQLLQQQLLDRIVADPGVGSRQFAGSV